MPPRSTLTPWIENLILSYGSRDEAGGGSTGGLLRAHVITVGQMTESQARDFDGPTGLIFLSDGLLQIPAVLTASAWERLQELEERECFRSLLNTTVLMRDYRLQFHMDPEVSRCRFFLSVGELATHSAGPVRDCTPCCTSLESVRTKIWRTWRSLLGQDCSQQPCSPDELDLTELLEEWQQDVLQTLLQDVRERLAALRRPQPSTSGRSPSLSCCRSAAAAATGWDADRVRYRGEPSFSVPASCLLIPEEDARRLEAETGGSGQTARADASSAEHAQSQIPEPAGGQTEQDAGGGMMSDPGGWMTSVPGGPGDPGDPGGGMDPGGSGGWMVSVPGGSGGGMDPGGSGGGMDAGDPGGPGDPGRGMMSDPGGRMDPGGSGGWMVSDPGGSGDPGGPGGGMTSVPGGPGDPGDSGERSPPLLEDAAPLPDLTAGLLSNPWDMFPPPGVSSSTSDSSPEPTPTLPCSQPDPVAVATSTQLPVQPSTAPHGDQPPASCSTGATPPEPPASDATESAVLENHGRPKRKLCDVTAEAEEPDLRGSPPSWLLGSRSGESSANEEEGGPSGSVPRRTPSVHGDGTPFSYSYRVLGQNLEDVSRFGVATSLLHWALRYLLTPEPAEHPQSVD